MFLAVFRHRYAAAVMPDRSAKTDSGVLHFVRYTCAMRALGFFAAMLGIGSALVGQDAAAPVLREFRKAEEFVF